MIWSQKGPASHTEFSPPALNTAFCCGRTMPICAFWRKGTSSGFTTIRVYRELLDRREAMRAELERLRKTFVRPSPRISEILVSRGSNPLDEPVSLEKLLKRPELSYSDVEALCGPDRVLSERTKEQIEIECKYEGYLRRQEAEVNRFKQMEGIRIPSGFPLRSGAGAVKRGQAEARGRAAGFSRTGIENTGNNAGSHFYSACFSQAFQGVIF